MAGPLARRSGVAIGLIMELIQWQPKIIYQVGVGLNHAETEVFKECWPDVELIGCEPLSRICRSLAKDYPGKVVQTAIGDHVGVIKMYQKDHHKDGSSVFNLGDVDTLEEFMVPITTLDVLYPKGPEAKPCLLWLDCEGSELAALKGAESFVRGVEVINVELTHRPVCAGWCDAIETHDWLIDHGFVRQWVHTQRSAAGQVDGIYVRPELFREQFCCCPCMSGGKVPCREK